MREDYKLIAIDLSKQWPLDADPKAIKQIKRCNNATKPKEGATMFSLLKSQKKPF